MTEAASRDVIARRVDRLTELWNQVMEAPGVRIGRWVLAADEVEMFEVFLELQSRGELATPDVLVHLREAFTDPEEHGRVLLDVIREESSDVDVAVATDEVSDVQALADVCGAFATTELSGLEGLAVLVQPASVANPADWRRWMERLARTEAPDAVRFMVVDAKEKPWLDALQDAEPDRLITVEPELDMGGALQAMSDAEGGEGPGDLYRGAFVALSTALGRGAWGDAERAAMRATQIASDNAWPHLEAAVHLTMGAGALGREEPDPAVARYENAVEASTRAVASDQEGAAAVLLQARMGEGLARFESGDSEGAAAAYEEAASLAREQEAPLMALEAGRMAAVCHQAAGKPEDGWRCGESALTAAAALDDELRASSTLPHLGRTLLEVAGRDRVRQTLVHERMAALAGDDWERRAS